jgi:hypothetical protein
MVLQTGGRNENGPFVSSCLYLKDSCSWQMN